jgi:hypothetical protein
MLLQSRDMLLSVNPLFTVVEDFYEFWVVYSALIVLRNSKLTSLEKCDYTIGDTVSVCAAHSHQKIINTT